MAKSVTFKIPKFRNFHSDTIFILNIFLDELIYAQRIQNIKLQLHLLKTCLKALKYQIVYLHSVFIARSFTEHWESEMSNYIWFGWNLGPKHSMCQCLPKSTFHITSSIVILVNGQANLTVEGFMIVRIGIKTDCLELELITILDGHRIILDLDFRVRNIKMFKLFENSTYYDSQFVEKSQIREKRSSTSLNIVHINLSCMTTALIKIEWFTSIILISGPHTTKYSLGTECKIKLCQSV